MESDIRTFGTYRPERSRNNMEAVQIMWKAASRLKMKISDVREEAQKHHAEFSDTIIMTTKIDGFKKAIAEAELAITEVKEFMVGRHSIMDEDVLKFNCKFVKDSDIYDSKVLATRLGLRSQNINRKDVNLNALIAAYRHSNSIRKEEVDRLERAKQLQHISFYFSRQFLETRF
jgi:hypothetical protein